MEPIFTVDWFSGSIPVWSVILDEFRGKPVRGIEIGSFQGRSARWLMETILTHPESRLTCVDTFLGSVEHGPEHLRDLRALFDHNLAPFKERLDVLVGSSLTLLPNHNERYELAYVDGDHHAYAVLEDAINAFRLLKYGGILIFDDYEWAGGEREIDNPKPAIDAFLAIYQGRYILLHKGYQVIVRKIVHE
jgi:predicted O-methyltransferase YrrM